MQLDVSSQPQTSALARARPWLAVIVATVIFALIPLLGLQLYLVVPLIGLVLALGTPPDYVINAKTIANRPRNIVLGVVVRLCIAVVVSCSA